MEIARPPFQRRRLFTGSDARDMLWRSSRSATTASNVLRPRRKIAASEPLGAPPGITTGSGLQGAVPQSLNGGRIGFACPSARKMHPHGAGRSCRRANEMGNAERCPHPGLRLPLLHEPAARKAGKVAVDDVDGVPRIKVGVDASVPGQKPAVPRTFRNARPLPPAGLLRVARGFPNTCARCGVVCAQASMGCAYLGGGGGVGAVAPAATFQVNDPAVARRVASDLVIGWLAGEAGSAVRPYRRRRDDDPLHRGVWRRRWRRWTWRRGGLRGWPRPKADRGAPRVRVARGLAALHRAVEAWREVARQRGGAVATEAVGRRVPHPARAVAPAAAAAAAAAVRRMGQGAGNVARRQRMRSSDRIHHAPRRSLRAEAAAAAAAAVVVVAAVAAAVTRPAQARTAQARSPAGAPPAPRRRPANAGCWPATELD